jgi:hypothetical protein
MDPLTSRVQDDTIVADIVRASYADGRLEAVIEVRRKTPSDSTDAAVEEMSKRFSRERFTFRRNGEQHDFLPESFTFTGWDRVVLEFACQVAQPTAEDLFTVEVDGFAQALTFKMLPCQGYADLAEIGPTAVQNGIALTATAQRIGDTLRIWCYPFKLENATADSIMGIGTPAEGSFIPTTSLTYDRGEATEIGYSGLNIFGRMEYEISESDKNAVLHIPYLGMLRKENLRLQVELPTDYTSMQSSASVESSLGTIRVTEIVRKTNPEDSETDLVRVYFALDSKDASVQLNGFSTVFTDAVAGGKRYEPQTGCLDYWEIYVGKADTQFTFDIEHLFYYLHGAYDIPLQID